MFQHATRWATLALALTLAAPAFAQSAKQDADGPALPRAVTLDESGRPATSDVDFRKGLQMPSFAVAPRDLTNTWSVQAFRSGDPDLFFEDFEATPNGELPDGWAQFETGSGDVANAAKQWRVNTRTVAGVPSQVAFSEFENVAADVAIDWLVTPEVTIGGPGELSFKSAEVFTTVYNSVFDVLVSTTSGTDPATFTSVASYTEADFPDDADGFTTFTVDLSAYDGQAVYVAFRHTNDDGDDWILDDVSITIGGGMTGAPGLAEDFEGGAELPEGWTQFDAGVGTPDGVIWTVINETSTNPDGNNLASNQFENVPEGLTMDYLVSPLSGIQAGDFLLFDAAQRFTTEYGSTYEVRVSTTVPDDAAAFTTVASYVEADLPVFGVSGFAAQSIDMSNYAGQDVYVAFVHIQDDGDAFFVDNIRTAAPADVSLESVAASVQFDGNASPGADPIAILGGDIVLVGESGSLEVTELTFSTAGTDDVGDIDQAIVAYTGGTATGDPVFFGDPVDNPDGTFTVTGSQEVSAGSNFFVVYYVAGDAPDVTRLLDATFENATVDGVNVLADPTALDGAVTLIAPPANDDFQDAIDLPGSSGSLAGSNVGATMQDGEPTASCIFNGPDTDLGNSVFYSYTAPDNASADLSVTLAASGFDTVMSFHAPDLTELACNDDEDIGSGVLTSAINDFTVGAGETVLIRIVGYNGAAGDIGLDYTVGNIVAGEEDGEVAFGLSAFRPNPTAGRTAVTLGVDQAQQVTVEVVDLLGRRVVTLHQGELAAGEITLQVPAGALAPGTYVVRALGETVQSMQRLTVTR